MNLDEMNENGFCKHGRKWTSVLPCGPCIDSRVGVYDDYGGYGHKWDGKKPIHCEMCDRKLSQEDLDAIIKASPRAWIDAFGLGPEATAEERESKSLVPHCEECRPSCERCNRSKAGLCPEPECVAEKDHRGGHGGEDGRAWSIVMCGVKVGGDYESYPGANDAKEA